MLFLLLNLKVVKSSLYQYTDRSNRIPLSPAYNYTLQEVKTNLLLILKINHFSFTSDIADNVIPIMTTLNYDDE